MSEVTRSLVICTTPRTGSNYLCEVLLTTWQFGWPAEWFNPATMDTFSRRFELGEAYSLDEYRDRILDDRHSPNGVFGLKLMWEHFQALTERMHEERAFPRPAPSLAAIEQLLPSPRYLLLEREDVLGQAISHVRAMQTQKWIQREQGASAEGANLRYDFPSLQAEIAAIYLQRAAWRNLFASEKRAALELTYESLVADRQSAVQQIAEWMGDDPDKIAFREPDNIQVQRDALSDQWREQYAADLCKATVDGPTLTWGGSGKNSAPSSD